LAAEVDHKPGCFEKFGPVDLRLSFMRLRAKSLPRASPSGKAALREATERPRNTDREAPTLLSGKRAEKRYLFIHPA